MVEKSNGEPETIECHGAPQWLTESYIEKALRIYYKDNQIEVLTLKVKPVTGKGEHYASIMTRISVEYTRGNNKNETICGSYIIKTSFESDPIAAEVMKPYDPFNREMAVYEKIMPQVSSLLQEINDNDQMFAETIVVDYDKCAMIFEDLSERSYVMADRIKGLDMKHVKLVLRKLAKLHATSAVMNERNPGVFAAYDKGIFNRHTKSFSPFFEGCLEACGLMVSEWENYKHYGQKLLNLKRKIMDCGAKLFVPQPYELNVLNHGDFWINNIMFKYNEDKQPIDALLIDFQFSAWASPAIDLHYFFHTSLNEDIRLSKLDELLKFYYENLSENLSAFNFKGKVPTLHQFRMQYLNKGFYAVTSVCITQALMLNEDTADADFEALMGNTERSIKFRNAIYKNKKVQENLKNLLPVFDRQGLLD